MAIPGGRQFAGSWATQKTRAISPKTLKSTLSGADSKTLFLLFFGWFARFFDDECFDLRELLLESVGEVCRPVLKEVDKAEGKENEKGQPKQTAQQCHCCRE